MTETHLKDLEADKINDLVEKTSNKNFNEDHTANEDDDEKNP